MASDNPKIDDVYLAALEKAEGEERRAYLDEVCGADSALRARVERLLSVQPQVGSFLESPAREITLSPTVDHSTTESPGTQVGPYKLLQQIGEGGFGEVWMAEQREPVKRRVALKVIKLGMDTKQVVARFMAERQALAMMDHPNIAKVFDAGSTAAGRPYFVMEYIKGVPITEYCDNERLDTDQRLGLFQTICHAVQHAHQKGIIHRDIKPSNVLVTLHDGEPVPKIIDFGIAKATNTELTTMTLFTEHRQMIGTPTYMSPEQAEMSGLDIDTRADLYSLGVLLYELLTGTTPFDTRSLLQAGYAEMIRVIREQEPKKPSTRFSTLNDTMTKSAQQRCSDVKKLGRALRGDLDWIVMRCLEKDRGRRYDTASGLAMDIQRHLNDEPVEAGPPSTSYKLQKFMKRNRAKVVTAATLIALLVLGIVSTGMALNVALEQRNIAEAAQREKDAALRVAVAESEEKDVALHRTRVLALTVASAETADRDPMRALLLAREAARSWMLPQALSQLHAALCNAHERVIFLGHKELMTSAVFSPGGSQILTSSSDGTARLWDRNGKQLAVLRGHSRAVYSAEFSPSGDRILTGSEDKTARIWDLQGNQLAIMRGHQEPLSRWSYGPSLGTTFSPDGNRVITASKDKTARVWNIDGNEQLVLRGHEDEVQTAVFSPSGKLILTASKDTTARLWDLEGNEQVVFRGHKGQLGRAIFSPAGDRILTTGNETARLWDLQGNQLAVLRGHKSRNEAMDPISVRSAVFSPSGDMVLTAGCATARLWDIKGNQLAVFRESDNAAGVYNAIFSPTGDRILTCGSGMAVRLWDLQGKQLALLRPHRLPVLSVQFSPSGNQILTAGDTTARLSDIQNAELTVFAGHTQFFGTAVYSRSGNKILTVGANAIRVWGRDGKQLAAIENQSGINYGADISPVGDKIVTAQGHGENGSRLWTLDGDKIKPLAVLDGHEAPVRSAVFSPTGDKILTASFDGTARVWDLEGKVLLVLKHPDGVNTKRPGKIVSSAMFSPDGKRIVTATHGDNAVRIWDLQGKELLVIHGHEQAVMHADFSPSGDRIISASMDGTARLWNLEGKEITVFRGHEKALGSATFSPDGKLVATSGLDNTARIWDLEGRELAVVQADALMMKVVFSPDGKRILTTSTDAREWYVHGEDLLKLADQRVSRELTEGERDRYADLLDITPSPGP